jgi:hypothetical protein
VISRIPFHTKPAEFVVAIDALHLVAAFVLFDYNGTKWALFEV